MLEMPELETVPNDASHPRPFSDASPPDPIEPHRRYLFIVYSFMMFVFYFGSRPSASPTMRGSSWIYFLATFRGMPTANAEGLDRIGGWRRKGLGGTRL